MKKVKVICIVLLAGLTMVLTTPIWGETAPQFLGETSWTITQSQNQTGPIVPPMTATFTGGITLQGGSYYSFQGYAIIPESEPLIVTGGGPLIENTLYLNLTGSQKYATTGRMSEVLQAKLDKSTLNGTFYSIQFDFDTTSIGPNPYLSYSYVSGSLVRTGPFINLTPTSGAATTMLLLD
jgi:hypothetical protein